MNKMVDSKIDPVQQAGHTPPGTTQQDVMELQVPIPKELQPYGLLVGVIAFIVSFVAAGMLAKTHFMLAIIFAMIILVLLLMGILSPFISRRSRAIRRIRKANRLLKMERYDEAVEMLTQALKLKPKAVSLEQYVVAAREASSLQGGLT
jgi:hypothetical protein